jgi:hypothetical protein
LFLAGAIVIGAAPIVIGLAAAGLATNVLNGVSSLLILQKKSSTKKLQDGTNSTVGLSVRSVDANSTIKINVENTLTENTKDKISITTKPEQDTLKEVAGVFKSNRTEKNEGLQTLLGQVNTNPKELTDIFRLKTSKQQASVATNSFVSLNNKKLNHKNDKGGRGM